MHNFILNKENEVYYECGYSCDNVIFLSIEGEKYFITDGRYTLDAKQNAKAEVITTSNLLKTAKEIILKKRAKRIIIDPLNWDYDSFISLNKITNLKQIKNYSHQKREIKTENELKIIKKAVKKGAKAFEKFKTEIQTNLDEFELSYRFKEKLTSRGRNELSFEPIVAINENSAKPHAIVSEKKLHKNDLLLLDAGLGFQANSKTITTSDQMLQTLLDLKR
jgi:Xaa-Pro aminopeptidase